MYIYRDPKFMLMIIITITLLLLRIVFGPKINNLEFFSECGIKSGSFGFLSKILIILKMKKWVIFGPKSNIFELFSKSVN